MEKEQKQEIIDELTEVLKESGVILLSDFSGMDVATATELRRRFREVSVRYRVVKNTLARRAAIEAGLDALANEFTGQNGLACAEKDPAAPAKILVEFEKKYSTPTIKTGWVEMSRISAGQVRRIAGLPSREVLLAQIGAGFQAPVTGFVGLMAELLRRLVSTLDQVAKAKGESGAS